MCVSVTINYNVDEILRQVAAKVNWEALQHWPCGALWAGPCLPYCPGAGEGGARGGARMVWSIVTVEVVWAVECSDSECVARWYCRSWRV